ncbi:glycosyltransferase family 39 protein [Candidatus Woesearchaeota archaeon]|nr:glycosyltransferase family 39 protein [Candidatus Woesearchaeota archaeon]
MNKKTLLLLILILFLGAFLRFYNLGSESFWQDESYTALAVKKFSALDIIKNSIAGGQIIPDAKYSYNSELPTYFVILKVWSGIFGLSEFSLRAFSAIFGILSLIAIFYLAKHLFGEKAALLASFLASINLTLIWYSQEARPYSFLIFLSLLSLIFLLKALKDEKFHYVAGFFAVNLVIIYTHFTWIIFMLFEGIYMLYIVYRDYVKKKSIHAKTLLAFFVIGLFYLPIIERALFSGDETLYLSGRPDIIEIGQLGVRMHTWLYPSESMRQKLHEFFFDFSPSEWLLLISTLSSALIIGLLFLIGLASVYKKRADIVIPLMFFFPLSFTLLFSFMHPSISIFNIRVLVYIIPAYLIITSLGCLRLRKCKFLIILIIILSMPPVYAYYANVDKQQFREASAVLPKNELVFVSKDTAKRGVWYYFGERDNVIGIDDVNELKSHLNNKDSFWVLLTFTKYSDPEGKIKKYLDDNYKLLDKKEFFDIEILHYRK